MNIVKDLRKRAGIQQKELALAIGVSRPTVSDWEANKKDPSKDRLKKLAEYFGVDELVILGKGVVDLYETKDEKPVVPKDVNLSEAEQIKQYIYSRLTDIAPRTEEARIIAHSVDEMLPKKREIALNTMKAIFADYFNEGTDNEPEL